MHTILNWLYHIFGVSGVGSYYGFWSGFGSDISELAILGAVIGIYRNSRCHVDGCHRHGKYPFQHYKLCHIHHPQVDGKLTHAHVKELHEEAK